jgi:hypothetical protein
VIRNRTFQSPWGTKGFFHPRCTFVRRIIRRFGSGARPHDLIALIEENDPGLSDDVRDEEELMRAAIRLLELPGSA